MRTIYSLVLPLMSLGSVCCAQAAHSLPTASGVGSVVSVPEGSLDFALPRTICDASARPGDTLTAQVTRRSPQLLDHGNRYGIGRDTTLPANLIAFLKTLTSHDKPVEIPVLPR